MTVMFPGFFGMPQGAIRSEKFKRLSGVAAKLYAAICYESERCSTREIKRTVTQLQDLVGGSPNSHIKARKELKAAGLIDFEDAGAQGILIRLCNPATGVPWPYAPRVKVPYQRKGTDPAFAKTHPEPSGSSSPRLQPPTDEAPSYLKEAAASVTDRSAPRELNRTIGKDVHGCSPAEVALETDSIETIPEWSRGAITYARGVTTGSGRRTDGLFKGARSLHWKDVG